MNLKTVQAVRTKLTEMPEGTVVTVGNSSYDENNATFKLEVSSVASRNVLPKQAVDFKAFSHIHGLPEGLLFQELCSVITAGLRKCQLK